MPFVSREALEQQERAWREAVQQARDSGAHAWAAWREQLEVNRQLVQQLADLKREGFSATPAMPAAPQQPSLPQAVLAALRIAEAGLPADVARAQRAKAEALLASGKKPEEVAEIITRGVKLPIKEMGVTP